MRTALRLLLAAIYFIAGVAHLRAPAGFLQITPFWVPWPETVVLATGLGEIAGAVALAFIPRLRRAAGAQPSRAGLHAVYGELADCLRAGRMFRRDPIASA